MRFDVITIFPEVLREYFNSSILGRARKGGLVEVNLHNLRDFAEDKHKKVDDKPFGGGPGMVLKIEPIVNTIGSILSSKLKIQSSKLRKTKIIIFSPGGKQFNKKLARDWAKKYDNIIMICGRYEGIDARIKKIIPALGVSVEEVSIGPYILTGGELPAAVVADSVSRQIPGVLGKEESLEEERYVSGYPLYTKPDIFEFKGKKYSIPKILKSGDHKKIEEWRKKRAKFF
ncbi:tRNA (guanosine(37)-N1)-methyltransferase TrmD [Candidatus Parcubacteria bacterium]|nr:MAG: tRNA (guanosine(37)-N1)-methyltransferase TrmD [Candidatus Parcubacteria bacterium]